MRQILEERKLQTGHIAEPSFAEMTQDPMFLQYWRSYGISEEQIRELWQKTAQEIRYFEDV